MHTVREREKLIARVRRIRGQIEGIERAIVEEKGCYDVLQTVTAARGALNSLVAEMIEAGARLRPHGITLHLIGPADARARTMIEASSDVRWHGFLPNDEAMRFTDGAGD